jgi:hypothetical protein
VLSITVIYIVVALLLLAILYGAYRALGRPSSPVAQPDALLQAVLRTARQVSVDIAAMVGGETVEAAYMQEARAPRRALDGCAQSLERLDPAALDRELASAHQQLSQAVEELGWALRMSASPGYGRGGLKLATAELRSSADRSLDEADRLLRPAAAPEEVHRPG